MPFINHYHPWAIRLLLTPLLRCIDDDNDDEEHLVTPLHNPPHHPHSSLWVEASRFPRRWWCCCDDEGCVDWCRICCCCWVHRRSRPSIDACVEGVTLTTRLCPFCSNLLYILTSVVTTTIVFLHSQILVPFPPFLSTYDRSSINTTASAMWCHSISPPHPQAVHTIRRS